MPATTSEAAPPVPKASRRRVSRWHRPFWWLNGLAVLALLLAYASARISPTVFWPLALFGTGYPFILLINLFFLLWWALFRRKRMLPSLIAILLGWGHVREQVQLMGHDGMPADARTPMRVMSWNTRLFDLYNWSHNKETRDKMLASLRTVQPDILCVQEFIHTRDPKHFHMSPALLQETIGTLNYHDEYTAHARLEHHFGIATFSKYPIIKRGSIHFPDDLNNLCIWSDIVVGEDTLRVYNGHLASLRFGDLDYQFMKNIEDGGGRDSIASAGPRILGRMKNAFIRRATEMETIVRHMRKSPYPVAWCGDMNDTPVSYSYHLLRGVGLTDAFVESGKGFGHTYIGSFPRFRIDHILHADGLVTWDFRTLQEELSDHRAIVCDMAFTRPSAQDER
ncbi:MAG TPA: endonuclease/exonuclease/phosphatase family protein [Flavobacteriales bacterium]